MKRIILGFLIAVIAFTALALSNTTAVVQTIIALPGSAGLLFALWELLKSNIKHQHKLEEQNADNSFILSATSHMAQKAFDKHVSFCEEYLTKVNEGLVTFFQEGPTTKALEISSQLYFIRRKYVVWETTEVSQLLNKFEQALRNIGADKILIQDLPVGKERTDVIKKMYATFKDVTDLKALPSDPSPEIAISHIIEALRNHLGVSQLTALRKFYISEAVKRIK
jgi:hypothetical protein